MELCETFFISWATEKSMRMKGASIFSSVGAAIAQAHVIAAELRADDPAYQSLVAVRVDDERGNRSPLVCPSRTVRPDKDEQLPARRVVNRHDGWRCSSSPSLACSSTSLASVAPRPSCRPAGRLEGTLKNSSGCEIALDLEQTIVFSEPLTARQRPGFDLATSHGHGKVSDERVFGLRPTGAR